ncbi:LexA family protein [Pseudomonas syringae]|uniref:LexA family protein n=1 Tax=Pseudomonas syringae TaxID=317 RepID=UPI0009B30904|nr:S24 family peptidase [Pseudomonas syringae]
MLHVLGPVIVGPNPIRKPVSGRVSCGFPSPALEYSEPPLSIDELVSLREPSRWLLRADGDSLKNIGIYDGDVLVVDKALEPLDGDIVVVVIGSDFCCKEFRERLGKSPLLIAHNPANANIEVGEWEEIELWGVVLWNLHKVSR